MSFRRVGPSPIADLDNGGVSLRQCPHGVNVGPLDDYERGPDDLVTSSYCDICNRAWELRGHDGYVTEQDIARAEADRVSATVKTRDELGRAGSLITVLFAPVALALWMVLLVPVLVWMASAIILTGATQHEWYFAMGDLPRVQRRQP